MDAGLGAAQFLHMAEAVAQEAGGSTEPIAVVRCADGWRTLFADGSSHEGRPCSPDIMDELGEMVDRWRSDNDELESLAAQWVADEAPTASPVEVTHLTLYSMDEPPAPARPRADTFLPAAPPAVRSSTHFVPWSVVEAMIDVEVNPYFRNAS